MDRGEIDSRVQRACKSSRLNWDPPIQPTMSERQAFSRQELFSEGHLWISHASFSIGVNESLRDIFLQAVIEIGDGVGGTEGFTGRASQNRAIQAEWDGYKKAGTEQIETLFEREKYDVLLQECSSDIVILYSHGGGYW